MRNIAWVGAIVLLAGTLIAPDGQAFSKDSLVWEKCTGCHEPSNGTIPRVQELRTTPEEWTVIVDRMARLHGMGLGAGEMATLLKELCSTQSLAPEEATQVAYLDLFDNPQTMEAPEGEEEGRFFTACVRCHSAGKVYSYRMTTAAWAKIRDFHLFIDPAILFQMREMHWRDEADAVLTWLAATRAYGQAWKAPTASPAGEWFVIGDEPGKGNYRGRTTLTDRGNGEYALSGVLNFADGTAEQFSGDATLYGGYALRTRARHNGHETMGAFQFVDGTIRGRHHYAAPDFRTSSSTWTRVDGATRVLRVSPGYLLTGETTTVTFEGTQLPEVAAGDIRVGNGVRVLWAQRTSPDRIEAGVVYDGTGWGRATFQLKGVAVGEVALAPRIDYITVTPGTGRARVNGGLHYPAEGVQFQAVAHANGPDVWDPADDVVLGPVPARFRLVEKETRPGDDDLQWLGAITANGKFLPTGDYGPIPAREYGGEGTGMVKVVAEYQRGAAPYAAEALLVVTVPDFIQRIK